MTPGFETRSSSGFRAPFEFSDTTPAGRHPGTPGSEKQFLSNKGYSPKDVGMPSYRGILSDSDWESLISLRIEIQQLQKEEDFLAIKHCGLQGRIS